MESDVALAKVPVPLLVHSTLEWFIAYEPKVMLVAPVAEHALTAVPAFATGNSLMVRNMDELVVLHGEFPVTVSVMIRVPEAISAALGV